VIGQAIKQAHASGLFLWGLLPSLVADLKTSIIGGGGDITYPVTTPDWDYYP
jgi:hypothetical protein